MTLSAARKEVASKTDRQIERETAAKWAARAIACWERAAREKGVRQIGWLLRAGDYKHEALEHAATVGDNGRTLRKISTKLERAEKMLDRATRARHSDSRRKKG